MPGHLQAEWITKLRFERVGDPFARDEGAVPRPGARERQQPHEAGLALADRVIDEGGGFLCAHRRQAREAGDAEALDHGHRIYAGFAIPPIAIGRQGRTT